MAEATVAGGGLDRRRWVLLCVLGLAQLMVVLDLTVMNIALPSAQRALQFSTVDRRWVVTAYTLSFGSLLLLGGKLSDLLGRKVTFLTGLAGFAGVSAIGGASVNFAMLITARACQGAFAALLVPTALSLLTTTFSDPKERNTAFGVFGAIAGAGGAVGLLLGGLLTEYLSWRWTLYMNLIFAGAAFLGGALLLGRQSSTARPRLDIPGVLLVSSALFCLVYGFSNAASHSWSTPSTYGFLAAGAALLAAFAAWQVRAAHPLLPPRVVLDRGPSRLGPADRPPGPGRTGAGARLHHLVLVDRRDLRRRRGHLRRPVPQRAADSAGHAVPDSRQGAGAGRDRRRRPSVTRGHPAWLRHIRTQTKKDPIHKDAQQGAAAEHHIRASPRKIGSVVLRSRKSRQSG
jgi:MFS family permease